MSLQGVKPKIIQQRIKRVAERLSITHILDKYPAAISGGQKQRVAAARALITEPTILADEPTGALDSKSAKDLLNMMDDLNTNDQVSILLVTLSASYCQRILFIKDGKIHQEVKREDQSREVLPPDPCHSRKLGTIRRKNTCFETITYRDQSSVEGLYRPLFWFSHGFSHLLYVRINGEQ